jgi:hypothetical protein
LFLNINIVLTQFIVYIYLFIFICIRHFSNCGPRNTGGLQTTGREKKALQKLCETFNKWKIHKYMSVVKLCSSVDLQQCRLISYFHNFLSYNHYFRKCFKLEYRKNVFIVVRFQVLTAASMMFRAVFWVVLPCKVIVDRRFRGAYCLHHQGWVSRAKKNQKPKKLTKGGVLRWRTTSSLARLNHSCVRNA